MEVGVYGATTGQASRFALCPFNPNPVISLFVSPPPTEDEMFSDSFKVKLTEDGMFYEVEGKVSWWGCVVMLGGGFFPHVRPDKCEVTTSGTCYSVQPAVCSPPSPP